MLARHGLKTLRLTHTRLASTSSIAGSYKVVVVGSGSAGIAVANQIYDRFRGSARPLKHNDIALVDAAEYHYYQPGWTLVGSGLKDKAETRRRMSSLIPDHLTLIPENVQTFKPESSSLVTTSGRDINYDALVVATGLQINWDAIEGLSKALADPTSKVSSIYSYDTCDKVWNDIEAHTGGKTVFTQPAGVIKCAGAPQKIMWMAWDRWKHNRRQITTMTDFYTGMPTMFSVKKYSDVLDQLRKERNIGGFFQHNLVSIDSANRKATFRKADGSTVAADYDLLHVTPPMGPLSVVRNSPIADTAGWVSVDQGTLQHTKAEYANIFSLGDCSSLPTSKTSAAITAQAPVLVENLFSVLETGKVSTGARYDGYTSCPLLTGYGELLLAEFKYGLEPKESFSFLDQSKPNRWFYHLKKDVFPAAYWNFMTKGKWFGVNGLSRPNF